VKEEVFSGKVEIQAYAENPVKQIKFNSKNLKLSELKVIVEKEDKKIEIDNEYTIEDEFVNVFLTSEIEKDILIIVEFSGEYENEMKGFYKSMYYGNPIYSTQFESSDARQAFPCFDQPDMKATFIISLTIPPGNIALSNTPLKEKIEDKLVFEKTPIMSTYLVAYVVGKLEYIEKNVGIPIRVYADKNDIKFCEYALDVASNCIQFFQYYFKIKYPLPKYDMVCIPSFSAGAMENWGLVTFRNTSLLFDEKTTPLSAKNLIASTICHELSHMWFGNLVTMKWWNDLWLNEGFATWAENLAVENIQTDPSFNVWANFINEVMNVALNADSLESSHPIAVEVNDPVEIEQIFDDISYNKGASLVRMIQNWVGEDKFREGLSNYLRKFQFSNAETKDLYDFLGDEIKGIMDPYVTKKGFPLITVEENENELILTQKRFTAGFESEDELWNIPIRIKWIDGTNNETAFVMREKKMTIERKSALYKLNDEAYGFYRVKYPDQTFEDLLNLKDITKPNLINLYSDAFALIKNKDLDLEIVLRSVEKLKNEDDYEVLYLVLTSLEELASIFYDKEEKCKLFIDLISSIIEPKLKNFNFYNTDKDSNYIKINSLVLSMALLCNDQNIIDTLNSLKYEDLCSQYLSHYLKIKVNQDFEAVLYVYRFSQSASERNLALKGIGNIRKKEDIEKILINLPYIENQDFYTLFSSLGSNMQIRDSIIFTFINNFNFFKRKINDSSAIRRSLEEIFSNALSIVVRDPVNKFLQEKLSEKELESSVKNVINLLKYKTALRNKFPLGKLVLSFMAASGLQDFYCEKIRVFNVGMCLNILVWNNGIGFWFYFVGF